MNKEDDAWVFSPCSTVTWVTLDARLLDLKDKSVPFAVLSQAMGSLELTLLSVTAKGIQRVQHGTERDCF